MTLTINTETRDNTVVVTPQGRLGFGEAGEAQSAIEQAIATADTGLVVNCAELEYLSSAGLRVFLMAAKAAEQKGVRLAACALTENVASVIKLSGFERVLDIHESLDAALAAVQ